MSSLQSFADDRTHGTPVVKCVHYYAPTFDADTCFDTVDRVASGLDDTDTFFPQRDWQGPGIEREV